jgi:Uma2 family endonuclease
MGTTVALMTVEEFLKLPENESVRRELHDGEVFELTRPKHDHWRIQRNLFRLLDVKLDGYGVSGMEYSFRPDPEYQIWVADYAFVSADREASFDAKTDYLLGSPDLVIEVESPSNSASEFERRESRCLRTGCHEFWIVYPALELVRVTTHDNLRRYGRGEVMTLTVVEGVQIAVDDIFGATAPSARSRP